MKSLPFILIYILFLFDVTAQVNSDSFIKKEKLIPTGTIQVAEGLYMDETEVSNIHYLEFLYYVKRDSSKEYFLAQFPDSTVQWNFSESDLIVDNDFNSYYIDSTGVTYYEIVNDQNLLRYPGYRFSPVVGISYSQAFEYCKLRSSINSVYVNQKLKENGKSYRIKYNYYLPSIQDFNASSDNLITTRVLKGKILRKFKIMYPGYDKEKKYYNASVNQSVPFHYKGRRILVEGINFYGYIYYNVPNSKGLYNVYGNVSELTSQEGISFGGAWIHTKDEILNNPIFKYKAPQSWLGFRCACKVDVIPN